MFTTLLLTSLIAQPPKAVTHETENPLFKNLLDTGMPIGAGVKSQLPAPTLPDGLDAVKQKAAILKLIGDDYTFEDFTRKSAVAPQLVKFRDIEPSDPKAPARGVDSWFIVYGDMKAIDDEKFRDRITNVSRSEGKGHTLTKEDLTKRKILVPKGDREGFGFVEFDLIEKVKLSVTGRAIWSRTAESAVVAAEVDPRFAGDAEFPNQWRSIIKEGGESKLGPVQPWAGSAFYLKITQLAEPAGALFCEQHVVLVEPLGWFDGANLLRSKLPAVIQNNVRTMRREWAKQP